MTLPSYVKKLWYFFKILSGFSTFYLNLFDQTAVKAFSGNFQISKLEFTKSIQGKLIKVGHQSFLEAMLNDLFNGLDWNNVQAFSHVTRQVSQVFFILGGFQLLDLIIKDLKSHMTC